MQSVTYEVFPQTSGRKQVKFTLTSVAGEVFTQWLIVPANHDPADDVATLSQQWDDLLAEAELANNVEEMIGG